MTFVSGIVFDDNTGLLVAYQPAENPYRKASRLSNLISEYDEQTLLKVWNDGVLAGIGAGETLEWISGFEEKGPFSPEYMNNAVYHATVNSGKFNKITDIFEAVFGNEYPNAEILGMVKENDRLILYKHSLVMDSPVKVHEQYETLGDYGGAIDREIEKIEDKNPASVMSKLAEISKELYGEGTFSMSIIRKNEFTQYSTDNIEQLLEYTVPE